MCFFATGSTGDRSRGDALDMRMFFGDFDAEQSSCTADIAQAAIAREIEFVGQRFEVDARQAGHPVEKALELFRVGIQFIEYVFAAVLGFVLRFPGAQRFRQIIPVLEQPRIEHLRNSTDVARAAAVEIQSGGGRVEIFRVGAVALTFEEFHCHERIEKICDAARMQVKFLADLRAREPALTECAEEIERDRSQQDLGIPEAERSLQNCVRCWRSCFHTVVDVANLPGVTSDEWIEKKIDTLRFIESRIRRGECELARKKCTECEAHHLDGAINSRQLLSIDFLRSAFSE
jgi:hypothetical protein